MQYLTTPEGKRGKRMRREVSDSSSSEADSEVDDPVGDVNVNSENGLTLVNNLIVFSETMIGLDTTVAGYCAKIKKLFDPSRSESSTIDLRSAKDLVRAKRAENKKLYLKLEQFLNKLAQNIKVTCFDTLTLKRVSEEKGAEERICTLRRAASQILRIKQRFQNFDESVKALVTRQVLKKLLLRKNRVGAGAAEISSMDTTADRVLEYRINKVIVQVYPLAANNPSKINQAPMV